MATALVILSLAFIFYTYAGYPLLLWLLTRHRARPLMDMTLSPSVTVVIAAYNEASCIGETIASILESDYPPEALSVCVVSDASTDATETIVSAFPSERVSLLRQPVRQGQTAGLLRGVRAARGDIVIAADASGRFLPRTVRNLIRHFADPRLGGVSGFNSVAQTGTAVAKGDGVYTRYDRTLRYWESNLGSSWVGCQGGLFALRKALFQVDFPLDMAADNALGYKLYEQGYHHRFDPEAIVLETPPDVLADEYRRKIRIIVLQLHGMFYFRRLFNPFKGFAFVFQNASHKMFRWLVPFALIVLWVASAYAARPLFYLQVLFYSLAVLGFFYGRRLRAPWFLSIPAYFAAVNVAGLMAWFMLFKNYTLWKPPARAESRPMA